MMFACRYPVILSIENHCSIKQQQAMAHYMTTIFGEKLCLDYVGENESCLPSPETLKKKIIVKVPKCAIDTTLFMSHIWHFGIDHKVCWDYEWRENLGIGLANTVDTERFDFRARNCHRILRMTMSLMKMKVQSRTKRKTTKPR